jgi:hypothetical protein
MVLVPDELRFRAEGQPADRGVIAGARRDGAIRTDVDLAVTTALISRATYAIARSQPASQDLADAFITVLMDGLRPQPSTQGSGASRRPPPASAPRRPRPR